MGLRFEWDPAKARRNLRDHGVSFEEATTAFDDELSLTIPDPLHSVGELRFLARRDQSWPRRCRCLYRTGPDIDIVRLISARLADRSERHDYEEGQG